MDDSRFQFTFSCNFCLFCLMVVRSLGLNLVEFIVCKLWCQKKLVYHLCPKSFPEWSGTIKKQRHNGLGYLSNKTESLKIKILGSSSHSCKIGTVTLILWVSLPELVLHAEWLSNYSSLFENSSLKLDFLSKVVMPAWFAHLLTLFYQAPIYLHNLYVFLCWYTTHTTN